MGLRDYTQKSDPMLIRNRNLLTLTVLKRSPVVVVQAFAAALPRVEILCFARRLFVAIQKLCVFRCWGYAQYRAYLLGRL
jgi:hypothetical protein